jgi:hypothetical protein
MRPYTAGQKAGAAHDKVLSEWIKKRDFFAKIGRTREQLSIAVSRVTSLLN